MRRTLLPALLFFAITAAAFAGTYTNEDIQAMKRRYEPPRPALGPAFLQALVKERWVEPPVFQRLLPFADWENEYRAYFRRHVGEERIDLDPRVLVMHYTATSTFEGAWRGFYRGCNMSAGQGTVFGHPSVHYMIDRDGTIYQLFPADRRCTGAYGVNHVALQIELVAANEADLVSNPALLAAGFRLARSLVARHRIPLQKVYGHYEVSAGQGVVPEYLDLADPVYPTSYPPASRRSDPGSAFMGWLRAYLRSSKQVD
ncbi:MAG: N-acetylmuramoyl-L-alanine amidase [Armatimonadetes bacterium]|nr:N-acetylmuramoyl-L-alanine amidase [Armatimonadota bacterium]